MLYHELTFQIENEDKSKLSAEGGSNKKNGLYEIACSTAHGIKVESVISHITGCGLAYPSSL